MQSPNPYPPSPGQSPQQMAAPPRRSRTGLFVALFLLFGLLLLGVLGSLALFSLLKMTSASTGTNRLAERRISGTGTARIARIDVDGVILQRIVSPFSTSVASAELVIEKLRTAAADQTVEAVLLRVDSPGGGVTASDRIHQEVARLRKKKKVAVLMGDTAASGGYYLSVAADRIFAHPTTVTGSIGVIMTTLNIHEAAKEIGVHSVVVKSAERKDLLSPFKPLEEIEQDKVVYQKVIEHLYDRFTRLVSEGRGLSLESVKQLADGSVYNAQTALRSKLIDAIGYEVEALDWLKAQIKKDDVTLFEYVRPGGVFSRLLNESRFGVGRGSAPEQLFPWWPLRSRPAYLWLPGI